MTQFLSTFRSPLFVVTFVYISIFIFVFLDLWAGIRKAKERGEYRSSYGLRKTVTKMANYYNLLFVITLIDAMQMLSILELHLVGFPLFPFLTIVGGFFIGFIELKSVYEKNSKKDKYKMQEAAWLLKELLKHQGDKEALEKLFDYLNTKKKSIESNETNS